MIFSYSYSESTAELMDLEVRQLIGRAMNRTMELLADHKYAAAVFATILNGFLRIQGTLISDDKSCRVITYIGVGGHQSYYN